MDKVLITGANGFIGSFLVEEALAQGFEVFAGVRKTSNRCFLKDDRIKFIELDLLLQGTLETEFRSFANEHGGFDYVIHNAGVTHAPATKDFRTINYESTCNLVNALHASKMPLKKFIFISSLAARGPGDGKTFEAINVSDKPHPISSYGKSKLMAEQYVRSVSTFPYCIFNPTAVYGPRDKDFLALMKMISCGFEFYIGRDHQVLSLIYVKDLVRAVVLAIKSEKKNCTYLISDGINYDKECIGSAIRSTLRKKAVKVKLPSWPILALVAVAEVIMSLFDKRPFLNVEKIREMTSANWKCHSDEIWRDLNTSPEFSLQRGIEETLAFYKQNGWMK